MEILRRDQARNKTIRQCKLIYSMMANQYRLLTVLESRTRTVPETLELVITSIEKHTESLTANHLLVGVMYTLMLECGYCLSTNNTETNFYDIDVSKVSSRKLVHETHSFSYENVLSQSDLLPTLISNEILFKVPFNLIGVPEYSFLLMVIPSGSQTVVNLVVFENNRFIDCYSLALTPGSFITMMDSPNVASKFYDIRNFSILFKDSIALKGRSLVLNKYNLLNNSLEGIPEEILLKIMEYLTRDDQEKFSNLSSKLHLKTSRFLVKKPQIFH